MDNFKGFRDILGKEKENAISSEKRDIATLKGEYYGEGGILKGWDFFGKHSKPIVLSEYKYSYNSFFSSLLDGYTFDERVDEIRSNNSNKINALELFGLGDFIEEYTQMTACMTLDTRNKEEKENKRLDFVVGNIFTKKMWIDLEKNMKKRGIDGFDLLVCLPGGPFNFIDLKEEDLFYEEHLEYYLIYFYKLLKKVYKNMNINGEFYCSIPSLQIGSSEYSFFITFLKDNLEKTGILFDLKYEERIFKITKTKKSPKELPNLQLFKKT